MPTKRRETPPDLGELPDTEIARREGVSHQRVAQWRQKTGIPRCPSHLQPPQWLTAERGNLGRVPDTAIAARVGVAQSTIQRWRTKLGVPAACAYPHPLHDKLCAAAKQMGRFRPREIVRVGVEYNFHPLSVYIWLMHGGRTQRSAQHNDQPNVRRIAYGVYEWCGD